MESKTSSRETPAKRLLTALDLFEFGVEMMRQNFRRETPDATEEQVQARLVAWLQERPGAKFGDCVGRPLDGQRR